MASALSSTLETELHAHFRPEFLNRLDEIIVFTQLKQDEIKQIAEIMLKEVARRLTEKDINLEVSDRFKDLVVKEGYNPSYGARPLRRAIMNYLEDSLAEAILSGEIKSGDTAFVDVDEADKVIVSNSQTRELLLANVG